MHLARSKTFATALRQFIEGMQPPARIAPGERARRLQQLVRHAATQVPFYRDLYRAHNIDIAQIRDPQDLWRLPAVNKADYLKAGPQAYTHNFNRWLEIREQITSGSLGQCLRMYAQPHEAELMLASLWSGWVSGGVTPNDRLFMLSAPYLAEEVSPFNRVFIPVQMPIDEVVEKFRTFEPTIVLGTTETIALLAVELKRRNIAQREKVRRIFAFGLTYTEPLPRMIKSGFDAEVFNLYGAAECSWLGYECAEHNGFHVPEGRIIVQVAKLGQPNEPAAVGERGELIVTSLLRQTTPFIRYRLYDVAALDPEPCPCGRVSPRIVNIQGRVHDFLIATDGRWVASGTIALDLWLGRPALLDYAVVQEDPHRVNVSLRVDPNLPRFDLKAVKAMVQRHLGPLEVNVAIVDELPREPSGKRRRVYRKFSVPDEAAASFGQDRPLESTS